ncbi:MAG: AtpZ/AtpI family protein [Bacillota bacterium]|nr:MAG: hypothetical protein DIU70_13485 [Bacillota bacterium]
MPKFTRPQSAYLQVAVDFGYMLVAAELLFGGGGYWLDQRRGAEVPWFTVAGVLLGLAVAFYSFFRRMGVLERARRAEAARSGDRRGGQPR